MNSNKIKELIMVKMMATAFGTYILTTMAIAAEKEHPDVQTPIEFKYTL